MNKETTVTIPVEEYRILKMAAVKVDILDKINTYDRALAEHARTGDAWATSNSADLNETLEAKEKAIEVVLENLDFEIKQLVVKYAGLDLDTEVTDHGEMPIEYRETNPNFFCYYECDFTGEYQFEVKLDVFGKQDDYMGHDRLEFPF